MNMEDRYLYKAKRKDNGKWEIGYLVKNQEWAYIVKPLENGQFDVITVNLNTVCQCTGLKDKNGKLIWENDIMVGHLDDKDDNYPEDKTYIKVLWRENGFYSRENGSIDIIPFDKFDQDHFEVCGNIFDNAELLESEG